MSKLKSFGLEPKKIESLIKHHDMHYLMANIAVVESQARKG